MAFLDLARKKAAEVDDKLRVFLTGTTVNLSNTKNTASNKKTSKTTSSAKSKSTKTSSNTSSNNSSTKKISTYPILKGNLPPNKGKTPILDSAFKAAAEERKKYESRTTYSSAPKSSYKGNTQGPKDYSSTVKYLEAKGVRGASGIMTENEWRRRKGASANTYQDYLDSMINKYGKGNIDLTDRPIYKNPDGTISTVASHIIGADNKYFVLPSIVRDKNGNVKKIEASDDVYKHFKNTGEYLGIFDTQEEAVEYAQNLYIEQQAYYLNNKKSSANSYKDVKEIVELIKKIEEAKSRTTDDYFNKRREEELARLKNAPQADNIAYWETEDAKKEVKELTKQLNRYIDGAREANFYDSTIGAFKRSYYNMKYGKEAYKEKQGRENEADKYKELLASDELNTYTDNKALQTLQFIGDLLGQQLHIALDPRTAANVATAGTMAWGAGQLVPIPEEVLTVPGAMYTGYKASAAINTYEASAGHTYETLKSLGVSDEVASIAADGVGFGVGVLEALQLDELVDAYVVGATNGASDNVLKIIGAEILKRAKNTALETTEEVLQEIVTIAGEDVAYKVDKGEHLYTKDEIKERLGETAETSFMGFGAMNVPAVAFNTTRAVRSNYVEGKIANLGKQSRDEVQYQIEKGLKQTEGTTAQKLATELKDKEYISDKELGNLVLANELAFKETMELDFARDPELLKLLINEAKEVGGKSKNLANKVEKKLNTGNEVSVEDVKKLIETNEVYIANENKIKNRTNNTTTLESQVREKTGYEHLYDEKKVSREFINSANSEIENAVINIRNGNVNSVPNSIEVAKLKDDAKNKISNFVGFDISDYKCKIERDVLVHIENRHGINGEHDHSLSDPKDIARIGYVLNNSDDISWLMDADGKVMVSNKYNNKDNKLCPIMLVTAKIDGTYCVGQVVPDTKRKTIWITSVRIQKADVGSQVPNSNSITPQLTSETPLVSSSAYDNTISQNDKGVNSNYIQDGENNSHLAERLEALSRSNEPIAVEDVKKVTGFGDEGSKMVAELANSEGVTFSQAERAVKTAYMAGFTNVDSAKVSFETDTQINAYTAGRKDRAIQDLAANERAKKADSYNGSVVETEAAISPEEAQRYDIPEDSEIVNNIVVDEHSKRLKRENPRAYSNIIRMAKRLRMKVRFVKNLVDENGNVLEGLITSKGIFINADAKNPSRFVATHEFGHRMKQAAPREWAAYQEYVINKLKRERFGNGRTAYDVLYEETKNAYGKDDADSINEEIAVNYAGELFDSEEMLESFIREDKSLAHKVRDWWYNVLESLGLLSEKKKAQQLWLKAYTAAGKNVKEGTVGEYSGAKFKYVGETKNGIKKYVTDFPKGMSMETKQELFKQRIATIFNLGAVKLKTDVKKIQVWGDRFTAQKNLYGDNSSPEELNAKINSLYDIAEILSDATFIGKGIEPSYEDVNVKPENLAHKNVKYWYYFKNTIEMDGSIYDVVFNIRDKGKEQYQYLFEFIEKNKRTTRISHTVQKTSDVNIDELSSKDNIPQNVPIVNSNSMQNLKKNTRKEQLDIINQNNPAPNNYLTWVRTEDDIKTLSEALDDSDYRDYDEFTPDYTREVAEQALATGKITVYSSYPITQGAFVTPSKMEAESYSGTGKVYEKIVDIKDVAWIDPTQGQYARVEEGKKSIPGTRLSELVEKYGAISTGENPHRDVQVPQRTSKDKKVSQTVRTILEAKATPDEAVPTIEKMVEDGIFSYDVYTDKQALDEANSNIKKYGWDESVDDWFKDVEKGIVSKQHTAMGWALYNNAANIAATTTSETERTSAVKTSLKILDAMVRHQRSAAQALQATRILKKLSPETQLYAAQKSVQAFQKELSDRYGDKAPNLEIDEELAEQFLNAKTPEERAEIETEIYKDIGRQMPSRFVDKWNAWRYLAMLGNVRTHVRNIGGNAFFAPVVMTKDLTATAIESIVYRVSGKKTVRGKALITGSKADRELLKAAWEDYGTVADLISNGGKYSDFAMANQKIEDGRQIFKFKPLELARKGNSALLEKEDMWFSKPHYAYALAQYCKANNITAEQIKRGKAIAPARDYAIKEAQKATYRDTNAFSQFVSDLGKNGKVNYVPKPVSMVVDGILPFRKTPANILVRGVEYSPLGLLKGLTYDLYQVSKGKMSSAEAIDNISAGLTGTALLGLGVYLAAQGLIRGHGEEDEEEKEFKELMGHQSYALELANGQSITLDWLAPEALPFFVGVNIWETTKGSDEELTLSTILNAIRNITEPMLEMSCLQGLNDLFEGMGYAKSNDTSGLVAAISSAVKSYLMQGLPTMLGQAERTGEEHRMTTYTEKDDFLTGDMQYTLGKASAKIPFWDYHQIPYIDAWGRKEASGVALKRGLNNFLNPAYTSTVETSKMEKELLRLYESTGETLVFPSRADKYFTVGKKRKDLTADEYVRYATLKGKKSYKLITDLVKSDAYEILDDGEKVKAIEEAYDYANQKAKEAISNYKPDTWVSKADEFSDVGSYITFRTEVSATKKENGDKISRQEVADIILDMAQNDSDMWNMYLSMYDSKGDKYAYDSGVSGEAYMYFLETLNEVDTPNKSGKYGTYTQAEATAAVNQLEGLSREEQRALWQSVNTTWKRNPYR